tara:strand:- start:65 stop:928 length:864 start_codon:yes stop_codon:yes gene_type:complete
MKKPNLITSQRITENWLPINRRKKIIGRATVGAGDIMYLYNVAHLRSHVIQAPIDLVVHWYHPENYLHHFEDPETLPERAEYLLSFYANDTAEVNINHVFDSNNYSLYSKKFSHFKQHGEILKGGKRPSSIKTNDWHFRDIDIPVVDKKITIWHSALNSELPRPFKRTFNLKEWDHLKRVLELQGYSVTFIDYRTPIREVLYHIASCECIICYEGMWHYIARNMNKPMIVLTKDLITGFHTPNALKYKVRKVLQHQISYFYDVENKIIEAKHLAEKQKKRMRLLYEN